MTRSMKSLVLSSTATLLLVGGGWVWMQDSSASTKALPQFPSPGQRFTCNVFRYPFVSFNKGPDVSTSSTGAISASVGKVGKTSDGRDTADVTVLSTFTKGTAEGIGDIVIQNDQSRTAPTSTLTSNRAGSSFPATQMMRFYPVVTLNGETFRQADSADPATLVNTSVSSFPAGKGTDYTLTSSLTLQSADGNTITVEAGKVVTLTGSGS